MIRKSPDHMKLCHRLAAMAAVERRHGHTVHDVVIDVKSRQGRYMSNPVPTRVTGLITAAQENELKLHLRIVLAGLVAEQLWQDREVDNAVIRPDAGYDVAEPDVLLLRHLLVLLTGRDDLPVQLEVQKEVAREFDRPGTWQAVVEVAELLASTDRISAEALEAHFSEFDAIYA